MKVGSENRNDGQVELRIFLTDRIDNECIGVDTLRGRVVKVGPRDRIAGVTGSRVARGRSRRSFDGWTFSSGHDGGEWYVKGSSILAGIVGSRGWGPMVGAESPPSTR